MIPRKGRTLVSVVGWLLASVQGALALGAGDFILTYNGSTLGDFLAAGGAATATYSTAPYVFDTGASSLGGGGIAFDEQYQYLYVTAAANSTSNANVILKFDRSGTEVAAFKDTNITTLDLRGITVQNGFVYAATASGVRKYDASTGQYQTTLGSISSRSATFDHSGNLFAVTQTQIYKWDGTQFISMGVNNITDGNDLKFDRSGNLYVANGSGRTIYKYTKIDSGFNATPTTITVSDSQFTSGDVFGLAYDSGSDTFYASLATTNNINHIVTFNSGSSSTTDVSGTSGLTGPRWMEFNPTPEPSTITLFGIGTLALHLRARRRKKHVVDH